jgi:hypothetical protein
MRAEAHITLSGDLCRMLQHAVVISGTSRRASISGNSISRTGSAASIGRSSSAKSRANPARNSCSGSPENRRPATSMANPLRASHVRPSIVGAQLRDPRSASWTSGAW